MLKASLWAVPHEECGLVWIGPDAGRSLGRLCARSFFFNDGVGTQRSRLVGAIGWILVLGFALSTAVTTNASASTKTLTAGATLNLTEDLVLSSRDTLQINGTPEKHCTITASGGVRIVSDSSWAGSVRISYCDFKQVGTATSEALKLRATGSNFIHIAHCTFDACGQVRLSTAGAGTFDFRANTILETCLVTVNHLRGDCRPSFLGECHGPGKKVFAGNHVNKALCEFNGDNLLVGGDRDEDSNFLIGMRCGLTLAGRRIRVAHNYIHTLYENGWSQVANIEAGQPAHALIEDNILHMGEWVVRSLTGELRNNVILDMNGHNWVIGPKANAKIHHNIFARYVTWDKNKNGGISVVYAGDGIEVYNNTFDGGGKEKSFDVPVIEVPATEEGISASGQKVLVERRLASLRNNVFYNFFIRYPAVNVSTYGREKFSATSKPARMGYADYNCFYNPDSPIRQNYAISVTGKTERKDAGFALHDLPRGGAVDAQVDPKFAGPILTEFPWPDTETKAGKIPVSKMLEVYRRAYTPALGSPLIAAGDPADGPGANIGAVDPGQPAKGAHPQ